jgi:tetratricopeptide (TPR) repeat protein
MQIEQRIESNYQRQNARDLEAMAASLSGSPGPAQSADRRDEWRSYYAALLAYRLVLLSTDDEARAWPFTERCIERLNQALVIDPGSAEALALQSACLALQSRLDPWRAPLSAPLSIARIDKALKLAPDNPRVLLLGAVAARDRPKLFGGDRQQAFALLKRSVAAFEARGARAGSPPAWGAADAFTGLAQDYLARGDALAARNVLERALLVAPDFGQARRLMARIVSG